MDQKFNIFLCANNSNKILFTSEFIKKQYLKNYKFKAKTYVSYLPFDFAMKSLKPKIKLKSNSFFFILSSNLKHKNLKLYVEKLYGHPNGMANLLVSKEIYNYINNK